MKTTSRFALVAAAAGFLLGGASLSARAADLGGDCCADLEERVAELEATTVRKGNRKVSLELSGQVDKALLVWNDGKSSDAYVTDNNYSSTRFRMKGTGQMLPGWKAGFYVEYEFRDRSSNLVDQLNSRNRNDEDALRIRQENVFVEGEKFGRVTLGFQNMATKDLTLINLGGGLSDPENYYAAGFRVRDSNLGSQALSNAGAQNNAASGILGNASAITWNNLTNALDANRREGIRYDTPSVFGFIASAFWGENDVWDVALRFQKEWNSLRIAGGVGYSYYGDPLNDLTPYGLNGSQTQAYGGGTATRNVGAGPFGASTKAEVVSGNISIMHVPTGLYATFDAAERYLTNASPIAASLGANTKDASYYYIQAGITKRFFDVGATTVYGEYGNYDNFAVGATYGNVGNPAIIGGGTAGAATRITNSNVDRFGVGFTQAFDGAALELFANYIHYNAEITAVTGATGASTQTLVRSTTSPEDYDAVYTGARLKF